MTIRLLLFGAPTVEYGGASVLLPFERRSQLLAYLALKQSSVSRAELAALLWPELESRLAYANLRKTLFRLQSVPWAVPIDAQGASLRLQVATDVSSFDTALREQRLGDALAARRGELLAGFDDDGNEAWTGWLGFERERLRVAWRGAALQRLATELDAAEGIDLSARLLEADPLDEAALKAHMGWLARGGQNGRARQAYREFAERIARELGLAPGAELRSLHDELGSPRRSDLPAAPAPAAAAGDGFIGRTVELRRVAELLARDDCRLLTVVGPGGAGKTSLARRSLALLAPQFTDGTAFVPLEDIAAIGELGGRIANEIGLRLVGRGDPLAQVAAHLKDRQVLLVLDNFEHLAADAGTLRRLLADCPRLKLIVTSRIRLAQAGEWLLPLEGLPCPEPEDEDRIEAFDAARLFVRAARRVDPTLVPAAEAASIIDICRQVEGLPLALELAASWTRVLSCDAIAAELHQGIDLLQAVDATQPPRHASFDTVFEQSWRLLGAVERDALARLSAFRGGFSIEAARAVAGAPLPVLGALADKSLLRKDGERLFLHPLVQQLAAARLGDGAAAQKTWAAHAAYFHRHLAQLKRAVSAGERASLRWVDEEFENCRRAWSWSVARQEAETVTRSAATLLDFCDYRGRLEDGLVLFRQAIESPLGETDREFRALMLSRVAHLEYRLDRYDDAVASASRALATTALRGPNETGRQAVIVLATCAFRRGQLAEARVYFKQTIEYSSPEGQAHSLAVTYDHLALIEKSMGQYAEALRLSLQSLAEHRRIGDSAGEALCLNNLGSLYLMMNENDAAATHLRESMAICERDGLVSTRAYILANLTEVALRAGALAEAEVLARQGLEVAGAAGNRAAVAWIHTKRARIALGRADSSVARSILAEAIGLALSIGQPLLKFEALQCFAELLEVQGEVACARQVLGFLVDHPQATAAFRDQVRRRIDGMPKVESATGPWPGLEPDELAQRVVAETGVAYMPLISLLRASP